MIEGTAVTYTAHGRDLDQTLANTTFTINTPIKPNQILLRTLATPINPSDIGQIYGGYNVPRTIVDLGSTPNEPLHVGGNEGVYEIIEVGTDIKGYQASDIVIPKLPGFGTWRSCALVTITDEGDTTPLIKVNGLTLDQAATISINPCTAYQILHQYIHDWNTGDWVVQNAGNSQVSKYLTQIAKLMNISTLSVIRDGKSQQEIDQLYELGATKVISELEFLASDFDIGKITNNGNVRLALNSVGGITVPRLVESLSNDGFLVSYGVVGSAEIKYDGRLQLFKNLTTASYWLTANTKRDPQRKVDTVNKLIELYQDGKIRDVEYNKVAYNSKSQDLKSVVLKAIADSKNGKQVIIYE